jgi:mRNA-degrading endonuclease HigB of HigAB toxin-antitoxin module
MYVELVQLMKYRKIENNINQFFTLKYITLDTNHLMFYIMVYGLRTIVFFCHVLQKVFVLKLGNHLENLHDACCCWKNGFS